ncbi:AIR synthase-related protein, partial [Campylobacter lari]|uniref:AIR synthase-related protein n=1 Tax=Campylobacter lari TaxID=201 RepID=UPI0037278AD2
KTPEIFYQIGQSVEEAEMHRSFNMGVGLVMVVDPSNVGKVLESSDAYVIGEVVLNEGVVLE